MIPYIIQYTAPNIKDNIFIKHDYIDKNKLNETIIYYIVEFINDFCNEEPGTIEITSYKDFCDKFYEKYNCLIVFNVEYFVKSWIEWNIEKYQEEIYLTYVNKYSK